MFHENSLLQVENDKLRHRVKTLQETVDSLTSRNASMANDRAAVILSGLTGQSAQSCPYTGLDVCTCLSISNSIFIQAGWLLYMHRLHQLYPYRCLMLLFGIALSMSERRQLINPIKLSYVGI